MAWGTVLGLMMGAAQASSNTDQYIRTLGYETASKIGGMTATKEAYVADVDAYILQNFLNEEMAKNAIVEAERAGGAVVREAQVQVKEGASKIAAQSEGITGGASKARELSSFYVKASKAVGQQQDATTGQIIKIADTLNKAKQDIAVKAEQSYQKMKLAIAGVSSYSSLQAPSIADGLSGLMSGAQMGSQFEQNMKDLTASNTGGTNTYTSGSTYYGDVNVGNAGAVS